MNKIEVIDFGLKNYDEVLQLQLKFFEDLIEKKKIGEEGREIILIGEHTPVITLGRRANPANILFSEEQLIKSGIGIYRINRGGDVTYHCPGQIIVYPILDLEKHKLGVKDFVYLMESAVIQLLDNYGIKGERIEGATGVWLGRSTENERKICAIGIKCSRSCTMHGLALNINADLKGFSLINPCGFLDKGVTSLHLELPSKHYNDLDFQTIKKNLLEIFQNLICQ